MYTLFWLRAIVNIIIFYLLECTHINWKFKKKIPNPEFERISGLKLEIAESIYVPEKREESGVSCFDLLIFLVETDKKCCYLYRALFTLGQGWSPCLFTQVCLELMLLFTVFVFAARPYLDSWDSHLLQTRALAQETLHLWGSNAGLWDPCRHSVEHKIQTIYFWKLGFCK